MVILLYLTFITLCDWPASVHPEEFSDKCSVFLPWLHESLPHPGISCWGFVSTSLSWSDLLLLWSFKWTLQVTSLNWICQSNFIIVYLRGFSCIRRIFDRKNQVMKPRYWIIKFIMSCVFLHNRSIYLFHWIYMYHLEINEIS